MHDQADISVIIATHNRSAVLTETLEQMSRVDSKGIRVMFIIVDNNSTDSTKQIICGYRDKMPIQYLFEARPGQNCARNRALDEGKLGEVVVFTDDDIRPENNWFQAIASACERWSQYHVFGGRIYPVWPDVALPRWTEVRFIQELGFAAHDYTDCQSLYETGVYPSSGNFWIRRGVLNHGQRFDEAIEWHPRNRIMATETIFFRRLVEQGYRIVHCPEAAVGHKITADQLSIMNLLRRSYSWGRGIAHIRPLCRSEMLHRNPFLWYFIRFASISRLGFKLACSCIPLMVKKPEAAMRAMQWLGFNAELLNLARSMNR